jgi:hypothetical protein
MHTSIGGSNVCGSGTAASSSVNSTYVASYAFDGNTGTPWESNGANPQWLSYDFGTGNAYSVKELALYNYSNAGYNATSWIVQWSDDNFNWNYAWEVTTAQTTGWTGSSWLTVSNPGTTINRPVNYDGSHWRY